MSFLAPLYVLGALAIALPILFHLIRQSPQGRQEFSSLMFLTPSPPRLTRKSRLSNIVLLILRAAALALLAFAFARPFFRQDADLNVTEGKGRRIAVLVDTSASMRRGDLWGQAKAKVEEVLKGVREGDEVALMLFDKGVRTGMSFAEWNETEPSRRSAVLRGRMNEAGPTWNATRAGEALAATAALVAESEKGEKADSVSARQVVLVSDMQQGGHVDALQGHAWPESVRLEVKPVVVKAGTNATARVVTDAEGTDGKLAVRVTNEAGAGREEFTLAWANEKGAVAGEEPVKVYVPAGRSVVVRAAWPAAEAGADRLVLSGDDWDFDNTVFVAPPRKEIAKVVFVGDDSADDPKGLLYYLKSAVEESGRRTVEVVAKKATEVGEADMLGARLVVVAAGSEDGKAAGLRRFVSGGGDVLWVLQDAAVAKGLNALVEGQWQVSEAEQKDFALISRIAAEHPLFAPFAESRFADFTMVHFWRHRKVTVPEGAAGVKVLASFDHGDPFLIEKTVGRGRVLVAASGWAPVDSQFALSTKFVPLMNGMLRRKDRVEVGSQYAVGEAIALPGAGARTVSRPDGRKVELAGAATAFDGADVPGVYRVAAGGEEIAVAVNLPADESRTAPVPAEDLESWGAKMGAAAETKEATERQRKLQVAELENRQKLWRWLIVGVLGLVLAETALAGRLARRGPVEQQQQQQQVTA